MLKTELTSSPEALVRQVYDQIEEELGAGLVPRIFRLFEANPALLVHLWGQFRTLILQGQLPRTLKEMTGLVVSYNTHCEYVQVIHLHSLTLQGVAKEALEALNQGDFSSPQFSRLSQDVLHFAALAVASRSSYSSFQTSPDSNWQELRHQANQLLQAIELSPTEKVELVATIALFEQICDIANLFELDPAQP